MNKIRSLFLAANPHYTERLSLDKEMREITEKVRASEYRDALELIAAWAVRPDDLLQNLNRYKPQIVHFSGHGSPTGEIILVDQNDAPKPVSAGALKALFTTLKDNVRLVILNACYSKIQAQSITQVIDCAIGMNDSIGDRAAITFIAAVYRAIGFGRSIKEAFEQGLVALALEGIPEEHAPELLVRSGVNPSSVILISQSPAIKDYDDFLSQGKKLLKSQLFEQSAQQFKQAIDINDNRSEGHYYLALAILAGRSLNAIGPRERETLERHLNTARHTGAKWLPPLILLSILEIDYYHLNGMASTNRINIEEVSRWLRSERLSTDELAYLSGIKISSRARNTLGLN